MDVKKCPHCGILIVVAAINCGVFRCGVYKDTGDQINPHLPKSECDELKDTIWGCGKPFRLLKGQLVPCEYV